MTLRTIFYDLNRTLLCRYCGEPEAYLALSPPPPQCSMPVSTEGRPRGIINILAASVWAAAAALVTKIWAAAAATLLLLLPRWTPLMARKHRRPAPLRVACQSEGAREWGKHQDDFF